MLDKIILYSLKSRLLIVSLSAFILVYGYQIVKTLPIDVFPDLSPPTVTIISEVEGLAPEEIETTVTLPIELAMNGANSVKSVRSSSSIGFSIVYVEFNWNTEIFKARQIVIEKLNQVSSVLPKDVNTVLGPVSSIMGEVMFIGITSSNKTKLSSIELRTIAEWDIKQNLLGISGISKITAIGGDLKQYHVLINPDKLINFGVTIHQVQEALENANINTTGGFLKDSYKEYSIRNVGRISSLDDLKKTVIAKKVSPEMPSLTLADIAEIKISGPVTKRGDASINGKAGILLAISKQPGTDTIKLTKDINKKLEEIRQTIPNEVIINANIFKQSDFIENAIKNVANAIKDGSILVALILFLFLLNFRTTAVTLIAIPLSLVVTFIIFKFFNMSLNTMTLGGLAIAIGELVDDAIVDVENIFRRLRQNKNMIDPKPVMKVIFEASKEIRNTIIFSTFIVMLVFLPLFSLSGLEGKIFAPLAISYITAIIASLIVSLTLTPALSSYLLPNMKNIYKKQESWLIRILKKSHSSIFDLLLAYPKVIFFSVTILMIITITLVPNFGRKFLPDFNEGSFTINIALPPGTSLLESNRIGMRTEALLLEIPEVLYTGRKTGRSEKDEHALNINTSELEVKLKKTSRTKKEIITDIRNKLSLIPGIAVNIGQPISHRIDFITSGIEAKIAIKIFGDDLDLLRIKANEVKDLINQIDGIVDLQVEQQLLIPQIHILFDRDKAKQHGVMIGEAAKHAELALQGKTITSIIDGNRIYDVILRLDDHSRKNIADIGKIPFDTIRGTIVPLNLFADIEEAKGPNNINRENLSRRIVIQANTENRDVVSVVKEIKSTLDKKINLPSGYFISYDGEFKNQSKAQKKILLLSLLSFIGMFIALHTHFKSTNLSLQVMLAIPFSFIGAIIGIYFSSGVLSIATMIGFITLIGISSRNNILLISYYLHLALKENEKFSLKMVKRGTQERLVPIFMTASTAILALSPLVLATGETGKEILNPVAIVIFSGLLGSTLFTLLLTPLIFWKFGQSAVENYIKISKDKTF